LKKAAIHQFGKQMAALVTLDIIDQNDEVCPAVFIA